MTARSETPPAHGSTDLRPDTVLVAGGRPAPEHDAPVGPSIVLTSTYRGSGGLDAEDRTYGRFTNPTWEDLEDVLARLERAELPALAYASGLAAVASVLSLVPAGGRLVLPRHSYQGSLALAADLESRGLLTVQTVDVTDTEDVVAALDAADLLWLESPTNPMLEVADLPALLAAARERGVLTCVDNTFATPLLQRPLEHGADIVVHSVTKYLAGHSDVVLGAAVTSDPALRARLKGHRSLHGAVPGPFEAWLALRGMRTLAVRVERSAATAGELARRLQQHPAVREVRYPGLPGDPGHERAAAQMDGFGSIVAIVPAGDVAAVEAAVDALRVWTPATSLGGVESLIERRRRHHEEPHSVPETLLRLSVGIENVEDLWEDLDRALSGIDR
ncbi:trans-sulfuration enzyme family protein [Kocuria rosea]|uniref:homocysteine desulfhydrase n=1 Tax=Kocuria rosea TaxID=1275 RepID=A0A4R5YAL8_KOCRO|nr:aminotransferase class I/II-fold pyridoxal phosphate-dependent enzyme [Kocuria rosea]TDL40172.1 aminotransferase class I/II-fold pyridoxal phosphate-dependent enzyme [Kocuria rosea]